MTEPREEKQYEDTKNSSDHLGRHSLVDVDETD